MKKEDNLEIISEERRREIDDILARDEKKILNGDLDPEDFMSLEEFVKELDIFGKELEKNGIAVKIVLDHPDMYMLKKEMLKQDKFVDYVCDEMPSQKNTADEITVKFPDRHTYEIFNMLGQWWGDWNSCPDCVTMGHKAREWQEKYGAELNVISHDALIFHCRCLSESEAESLWNEICRIAPNSQHLKANGINTILKHCEFALWWD